MQASSPESTFHISCIDISPFLKSPEFVASQKIVDQVRTTCETTGFFQITGHGVSKKLQDEVFQAVARLFALDIEEKNKLDKSKSVGASSRGYEMIWGQILQDGTLPYLKEGYYIGKEIPADDPRVKSKRFPMGPNLWPDSSLIPEHLFRQPMEKYYEEMFKLSLKVLDLFAASLPYGSSIFKDFTPNDAVAAIRLLHYPPDHGNDERQLGAGAHTDFGAMTLLLQDGIGVLQVYSESAPEKERWVDVNPDRNTYVVNIGDMLQMWTNGRYKSGLHRVVNRSGKDRYSIPYFFDGNVDCVLSPLDGSQVKGGGPPLNVEGHMKERFKSTYGK
ncbi:hypothetical protein HYALB_00004059, partial [Hymenoscyphus albidus]